MTDLTRRFVGTCSLRDLDGDVPAWAGPMIACYVESLPDAYRVMIDTAAQWSILSAALVRELGAEPDPGLPLVLLSSRLGLFRGWLDRFHLAFDAENGESLSIDVTWFVCPDWPGPAVLGWQGGLDRFFFALQPDERRFYFAAL